MKISYRNKEKISEQILALFYSVNPKSIFAPQVAKEIARDKEFVKKILLELKTKGLLVEIKKNSKGFPYLKRSRWRLSDKAYKVYKHYQIYNQMS